MKISPQVTHPDGMRMVHADAPTPEQALTMLLERARRTLAPEQYDRLLLGLRDGLQKWETEE
jgi:hypothetical protein